MSKIRKMTAIRKNRIEKEVRAESLGSNPHSKGLSFLKERILLKAIKLVAK